MLKLLITGLIIYFIYRYFIAPLPQISDRRQPPVDEADEDQGEYIDYEEVD